MVDAVKLMFSNYSNFKGRTSRHDFWFAILGYFIMALIVGFVAGFISGITGGGKEITTTITGIFELVTILPLISMEVRRLHDVNKAGWWIFIETIPIVGAIILLIFFCSASVDENNRY